MFVELLLFCVRCFNVCVLCCVFMVDMCCCLLLLVCVFYVVIVVAFSLVRMMSGACECLFMMLLFLRVLFFPVQKLFMLCLNDCLCV